MVSMEALYSITIGTLKCISCWQTPDHCFKSIKSSITLASILQRQLSCVINLSTYPRLRENLWNGMFYLRISLLFSLRISADTMCIGNLTLDTYSGRNLKNSICSYE